MTENTTKINFQLGKYINDSINFMSNNLGEVLLAFLFTFIMSLIPFCGLLAIGNFSRFCRDLDKNKSGNASDVFDFNDFKPYFFIQLIIFAAILAIMIPFGIVLAMYGESEIRSGEFPITFTTLYFAIMTIFAIYIINRAFYMVGLISLNGETNVNRAWDQSLAMSKGNVLMIILFGIIMSFIAQFGFILCGIGIFLTMPVAYVANYFAYQDGIDQYFKS